jgi:fatty-acyl-CoA synthase
MTETGPRLGTAPELLDRAAQNSTVGLIWNDSTVRYAEIASESRRVARALLDAGIASGDHVALWMPNGPQFLSIFFACSRIGVAVMLVNTRLAGAELADIVNRSDSKALFYNPDFPGGGFREALLKTDGAMPGKLRLIIEVGSEQAPSETFGKTTVRFDDLLNAKPLVHDLCSPESPALLYSTSGSTGPSKLVLHTQSALATHAQDIVRWLGLDALDTVYLVPIPIAGAYGFTQMMAAIAAGRPLVLLEKFDPASAFNAIRKHRVTHFGAFDEIIIKLLEVSDEKTPFPSLKACMYGIFTPGYADFQQACEDRGIKLAGLYGSSELQAFFVTERLDAPFKDRIRHGGFPVSPQGKARIRHLETGDLCPVGVSGELEVFGPSRMKCYYNNEKATAEQILPDGFYKTGDTAHMADDGSVVFEGRMEEILRLSGYMVPTAELETSIMTFPGVHECKVVGVLTQGGTRPVSFIVTVPGRTLDIDGLKAECAAKLARFKQPIAFHVVEAFPLVNSLNAPKVDKKKLQRTAQELHDQQHRLT